MSYIRNTSNPENLYIYADEELVYFLKGHIEIGIMPVNIFNGLIKKYIRNSEEECEYKKAKIEEINIIEDNISIFKNKLSYNGLEIIMWTVTWYYLAMNNYKNILKEDKINNKIKK